MILTVTLNPCIDKSSAVARLKPEVKLRCTEVVREPGGGGINVSKALKKLDTSSVALFPAGGHNGHMLKALLKKEEIAFQAIDTTHETRENWIVFETETDNQYRFTFPGLPIGEEPIRKLIDQMRGYAPSFVAASGSLPPELPDYFYGLIVKTANAIGARCVVDTSGSPLRALKGKHAFMLKPNLGELCKMLNIATLETYDVPDAAQQAVHDGFAEIIVISMGADGAWMVTRNEKYFAPAPAVERKSTVGAGDSVVAGILYMLQKQQPLFEALAFGVACGTAATMNAGTQLFERADAEHLYQIIRSRVKS